MDCVPVFLVFSVCTHPNPARRTSSKDSISPFGRPLGSNTSASPLQCLHMPVTCMSRDLQTSCSDLRKQMKIPRDHKHWPLWMLPGAPIDARSWGVSVLSFSPRASIHPPTKMACCMQPRFTICSRYCTPVDLLAKPSTSRTIESINRVGILCEPPPCTCGVRDNSSGNPPPPA